MYKYIGPGYFPGIPAHDLTDAEAVMIGKKRIRATGLYKEIKNRPDKNAGSNKSRETFDKSDGANPSEEAQ